VSISTAETHSVLFTDAAGESFANSSPGQDVLPKGYTDDSFVARDANNFAARSLTSLTCSRTSVPNTQSKRLIREVQFSYISRDRINTRIVKRWFFDVKRGDRNKALSQKLREEPLAGANIKHRFTSNIVTSSSLNFGYTSGLRFAIIRPVLSTKAPHKRFSWLIPRH
jgi:hypothetical protein